MYIVVNDYYTDNQAEIDTVVALATGFVRLQTNIGQINKEVAGQSVDTTGVAKDKTALRDTLNSIALNVMTPAKAWTLATGNNTLADLFNYPISELEYIKDDTMQGFCSVRIAAVIENLTPLADYGITSAETDAWEAALNAYVAVLASPREAINTRHLHTTSLKALFSDTAKLFRETLDPLMLPFKTTNPPLYEGYKQARIVINRKGQSAKPKPDPSLATVFGTVTDQSSGFPLEGAVVSISNNSEPVITTADGKYSIAAIQPGEYIVTVTATDYDLQEETITLEEGVNFELNVELNPIAV